MPVKDPRLSHVDVDAGGEVVDEVLLDRLRAAIAADELRSREVSADSQLELVLDCLRGNVGGAPA